MDMELEAYGERLAETCRQGKTGDAYSILKDRSPRDVAAIALKAGFACIDHRNRREFMAHLISQVAEACRRQTDGFGLRHQLAQEIRAKA